MWSSPWQASPGAAVHQGSTLRKIAVVHAQASLFSSPAVTRPPPGQVREMSPYVLGTGCLTYRAQAPSLSIALRVASKWTLGLCKSRPRPPGGGTFCVQSEGYKCAEIAAPDWRKKGVLCTIFTLTPSPHRTSTEACTRRRHTQTQERATNGVQAGAIFQDPGTMFQGPGTWFQDP